jgi:hypothetical protein
VCELLSHRLPPGDTHWFYAALIMLLIATVVIGLLISGLF